MGVNKFLKASNEQLNLTQKEIKQTVNNSIQEESNDGNSSTKLKTKKVDSKSNKQLSPETNIAITKSTRKKPGRPTNEERGLEKRVYYGMTLSLKEKDFNKFKESALNEDITYSKWVERAIIDYLNNHPM